jgi:hypothetical protein
MNEDYGGPERRSAESLLARELLLVKRRGDDLHKQLEETSPWQRGRRAKLKRTIEISEERQGQILETLGGKRPA